MTVGSRFILNHNILWLNCGIVIWNKGVKISLKLCFSAKVTDCTHY